jgi:hypothetical protein
MTAVTRDELTNRLQESWQPYMERFQALTPDQQSDFLLRQGYASLSALLAHIIAWWQDGEKIIQLMRGNPGMPLADYDVDSFNARAVERFAGQPESAMRELFNAQCAAMLRLVIDLSDAELAQTNINTRLYYEILMHWTEHELN